jgi:hypothetical protein
MKTLDLARAAAQAEGLRLRRLVRRQAMRAVFGAVCVVFLLAALVLLHAVAFTALAPYLTPLQDSAVLLGGDLVVAVIFGLLAARDTPDAVEVEAKQLRDQSLGAIRESIVFATLLGPLGRLAERALGRKRFYGLTLAALAASFLAGNRKRD